MAERTMAENKDTRYASYQREFSDDITSTIQEFGCQPILFIGSGLSRRYLGAPSWDELLGTLASRCPLIERSMGYYRQTYQTPPRIGEEFARQYQEWAWGSGREHFPDDLFGDNVDAQAYVKYEISEILNAITPNTINRFDATYRKEISALQQIRPHAVITTNYDRMLEIIFPDHQPVVGQQILKGSQVLIGEIFKIHGSVDDPDGIVFTQSDYDAFVKKKKFLSAKLLTFFNEHPLIFIGYSATDPNIRSILSDIDEALPERGGVIPNVYILEWKSDLQEDENPPREKVIATEDDRTIRVKLLTASDFSWVFKAFSANPNLNNVNPRVLRALLARSYNLVRHDIPKSTVQADFKMLTDAVEDSASFAKLFGIANVSDYSAPAALHPYSPSQLGRKLGFNSWHKANKLIERVSDETGINIKSWDNKYHRAERVNRQTFHKYSDEAVSLLRLVKRGQPYIVEPPPQ
jgi:hypothetical protein